MTNGTSLEGWVPEIGPGLSLAEVVDKAFDYRGNITVVRADGSETEGYPWLRATGSSTHRAKSAGPTLLPHRIVVTRRPANR